MPSPETGGAPSSPSAGSAPPHLRVRARVVELDCAVAARHQFDDQANRNIADVIVLKILSEAIFAPRDLRENLPGQPLGAVERPVHRLCDLGPPIKLGKPGRSEER